ncbi:LAETG motif-containing sortase-dependent surface protein [Streptomyces pristinaespiralis]|uniref:LAETG motif-containing sortase-dependent surface protein n=1 Tax=Streptomyces pristinaespiralis TaxID=38300 RepID=UPI0037BD53B6
MKLRRAMAVAAATAVIAPATFLAAPAAFATDSTPSATETTSPAPTGSETTSPSPTGSETTSPAPTGSETTSPAPTGSETTSPSPTGSETTSPAPSPSTSAPTEDPEDPEEPPYCEELDENWEENALGLKISGLPGQIVAGSGWEEFNLTVTNNAKTDLKEVAFYAEVENDQLDEDKWLSKHVELQFRLPGTDQWERIGDSEWAGDYFWGVETMKSKDFVKIDLRINVAKTAPAADSYSLGSGGYLGDVDGQECIAESAGVYADFTVLAPGSPNPNPGEAEPGDGEGKDKGPDTKPQGDVKELPVTGNLAETGSDSALPVIGAVGGVAILAGAGVVFAMKRRRGDATA